MDVRQDLNLIWSSIWVLNERMSQGKASRCQSTQRLAVLNAIVKTQQRSQTAVLGGRSGLCKSLSREWPNAEAE